MKRIAFLFVLPVVFMCSCSDSSAENDAKKLADFACKRQQLTMRVMQGDENAKQELETLWKKREEFSAQLDEKYKGKREEKEKVIEEAIKLGRKCTQ
jgi:outer membrane lipoprotein-sorting protein